MPENGLMRYITIAAIVLALYLLFSKKQAGTVAQISPNTTPQPLPGVNNCCNSAMISVNDPIPIATDYLPCTVVGRRAMRVPFLYSPSTSPVVARSVKPIPTMPQPTATMQNVAKPYGVSQSNCVPGISAAQSQKIFPPAKKVTVLSGSNYMSCTVLNCTAGCYAMGHCGPNEKCLVASEGFCNFQAQNCIAGFD